jgi:transcription termination factor NusB
MCWPPTQQTQHMSLIPIPRLAVLVSNILTVSSFSSSFQKKVVAVTLTTSSIVVSWTLGRLCSVNRAALRHSDT